MTTKRGRWTAARDGIAHLHRGAHAPRTLCGLPTIAEMVAWPAQRKCLECLSREATAALPEALLLAGYSVGRWPMA